MKNKILILSIIVITIILLSVVGFKFYSNTQESDLDNNVKEYCTYLVYNSIEEREDLDAVGMVFSFNKENVCIDCRMVWTFNTEEIAKENYENWKKSKLSNLKIETNKVAFNADEQIGKTKEEIRGTGFGNFEISEY